MEVAATTTRPRNVDWKRAAALLYGDWGTSKAYVPGIAFAIAMYHSFWIVLAVSVLTLLVGINYIWVCKYFPEGGGVYSAAKQHARWLALVGGFLLVADYLVTAALSCFEAFVYFNFTFEEAKRWAILTIFLIGVINFFGPRHSGSIAIGFAVATVVMMILLALACVPQIPAAVKNLERPVREPLEWWVAFTGVILALSGVESIANMTGVMQLDPGSTPQKPRVAVTARKAIVPVMVEVVVLTALFGLAMHAIAGMGAKEHEGDMLRHMGQVFVDQPAQQLSWLAWLAERNPFSLVMGLVLGGLLLSATNTAIVALVSVLYLMAKDNELPKPFAMLNRFGVPWILMLIAILAPILVIDVQPAEDALHGLAALYAIGVVGAIAVNLGSTALNFRLPMLGYERGVMMVTFLIMVAIWVTIAVSKPFALLFALIVVGLGFLGRAAHKGFRLPVPARAGGLARMFFPEAVARRQAELGAEQARAAVLKQLGPERPVTAVMVAARGVTPTLRFAVEQARRNGAELYVLFVRELYTTIPVPLIEEEDPEAQAVFGAVRSIAEGVKVTTIYAVSDDPAWTILDNAAIAGVDMLILGHSRRSALTRVLRGDLLQQVATHLPEEIRLLIVG
jgi:amino acid transporter/nucleotide-binding universal stress UspA family protein